METGIHYRGQFFSPVYLTQAFLPRHNTFVWLETSLCRQNRLVLQLTRLVQTCLAQTIQLSYLSEPDKLYALLRYSSGAKFGIQIKLG